MSRLMNKLLLIALALCVSTAHAQSTRKISELPTGQKVGNILDETLRVGGGATTATTPTLTVPREDSSTNTAPPMLRLQRTSSGTPATGIGARFDFEVETSASNNEIGASIEAVTTDVTGGSEDFDMVFKTMRGGSTTLLEGLRISGTATTSVVRVNAVSGGSGYLYVGSSDQGGVFVVGSDVSGTTGTQAIYNGVGFMGGSTSKYGWTANPTGVTWNTALDTALERHSAGVAKLTNGSTTIRAFQGGGAAIASAAALPVPTGRVQHVTGTTGITSITSTNLGSGVCTTLIFDDALTVTDGSNLKLAGNFTTTADDTLSVCYDGTNWYETGRSVN